MNERSCASCILCSVKDHLASFVILPRFRAALEISSLFCVYSCIDCLKQALKYLLQASRNSPEDTEALSLAVQVVGEAGDDVLANQLIELLLGEVDGEARVSSLPFFYETIIPSNNKHLFSFLFKNTINLLQYLFYIANILHNIILKSNIIKIKPQYTILNSPH